MPLIENLLYVLLTLSLIILSLVVVSALQALYLKRTTIRLPEAAGSRLNLCRGNYSLLHIGESPVAGVGVPHISNGLTASTVKRLESGLGIKLDWQILAENGLRLHESIKFESSLANPDILVISFGVNDTTKFTKLTDWERAIRKVVGQFAGPNSAVFVTQVPNLQCFPLLPFPLNLLLGKRAKALNARLKKQCLESGWQFVESNLNPTTEYMAKDGYHPNEIGCALWAETLYQAIDHSGCIETAQNQHLN